MTDWYKSQSTVKPDEYDTASSPSTVYQRRAVRSVKLPESVIGWEYEERRMTRDEYIAMQTELESPATKLIMQMLSAIELRQEMMGVL